MFRLFIEFLVRTQFYWKIYNLITIFTYIKGFTEQLGMEELKWLFVRTFMNFEKQKLAFKDKKLAKVYLIYLSTSLQLSQNFFGLVVNKILAKFDEISTGFQIIFIPDGPLRCKSFC